MNHNIIGLTGAARAGKDTSASIIESFFQPGATLRLQLAGPLKKFCREVFDWTEEHTDGSLKETPDKRYPRIGKHIWTKLGGKFECSQCGVQCQAALQGKETEVLDPYACTSYLTPREAMQKLGGEWTQSVYPALWPTLVVRRAQEWTSGGTDRVAIITDVRRTVELAMIRQAGGIILDINRKEAGLTGLSANHSSETERISPEFQKLINHHISNDRTLGDLKVRLRRALFPNWE